MAACSIVIRCYNEEKHIERLLFGITQQTLKNVEVILVDSGSTDRTLEIARQFPVEIVHIRPEEFTFGYSLNQGIAAASSDIVTIASAHIYPVYPDWLEQLIQPFKNPRIALTYGKQRGNEVTRFSEKQIFNTWYPDNAPYLQRHPFCNNANAAVRRSLWETNKYNENLTGLEDLDWANWCIQQSHLIGYVPQAEIIHVHEESNRGIYNRYKREAWAFKQIYPGEKFYLQDFVRLFWLNSISDGRAALKQGRFFKELTDILRFRFLQFFGTYRGYRQTGPLTWKLRKAFYYPRLIIPDGPDSSRNIAPIDYDNHTSFPTH